MKLATIQEIIDVYPHPNADSLEFVKVLGYQCIVQKGKWKVGDFCVLIQPDTVLPNADWSQIYKAKSSRVRAIKLRGEWSFGIVEDLTILPQQEAVELDKEVSEILGIIKYEPPMPQDLNAVGGLPHGIPKTDEERFQNLKIEKFYNEVVDVSLKIDGQSFTVFCVDGEIGVCGRTMEYNLDAKNNYTANFFDYQLKEKLKTYCEIHNVNIALRGEQYGNNIQKNNENVHSKAPLSLAFFSCWDINEKRYYSPNERHYYRNVCEELNLPTVPLLEKNVVLTPDLIQKYQNLDYLNFSDGKHLFEGVVVVGKNFSFKVINLNYDSKK